MSRSGPTRRQVEVTRSVVTWYVEHHYGSRRDPGMPTMFMDRALVGSFAISEDDFRSGESRSLFRLLVATTMFQRRQDLQIMRVLREMPAPRAREVTDARKLLRLLDDGGCPHARTVDALITRCDLSKDSAAQRGFCASEPNRSCHLKHHTVWLKRYGHFGKVPTSLALTLKEAGVRDLAGLRAAIVSAPGSDLEKAVALESALCRSWRVNQKIASMFLSMTCNPDLPPNSAPWASGLDWTYYVVIDSNVDLFLAKLRYGGSPSYDGRRSFVRSLAEKIDLSKIDPRISSFNPRVVQQAMYLFMSATNRRAIDADCMHVGEPACRGCPKPVASNCPVRRPIVGA